LAEDIAVRWIRTNYAAYKKTGTMHEKHDVTKCGEFGGGGEYVPQVFILLQKEMVFLLLFLPSDLNVSWLLLHCRLVLVGQMELFWLFWRSLDGLKTEQYIANDLGVCNA
jgi:hypothetical protein